MTDRHRGTLIGLAIGDALGAAVEFKSPGSFAPVTGYRDGEPHGLEAGEWTDDTPKISAMSLGAYWVSGFFMTFGFLRAARNVSDHASPIATPLPQFCKLTFPGKIF